MAEARKRTYRHPKYKTAYHVKNWPEYEKSPRNRGDIIIWLSRDTFNEWTPPKNGKKSGQLVYSDIAIETSLVLRMVFHLPLRQVEGFLKSILKLMDLHLHCPTIPSVLPFIETIILRRSGAEDGPSGKVNLNTICKVTQKTHSIVTRESLGDG